MRDSQINAISNTQFDDWEADWEAFGQSILNLGEAIVEMLVPAFQQTVDAIRAFVIQLQRVQLYADLMRRWWIPDRFAHWLSDKWPERWLPELKIEGSDL